MESRKLISFGSSSYVVSIPKSWIKKNKLEKGAQIYLDEKQDELVLSTNSEQKKRVKEIQIDATGKSLPRLKSEIVASYLNNYDTIEIRNAKDDDVPEIKAVLRNLAGIEIMEQTQTKIVVKDLINIKEVSIKTLIRRMDIIIRSMFDDLLVNVNKNMESLLKSFYQRDTDINRLFYLVRRMITAALEDPNVAKILDTNPIELVFDWGITVRLEKIGDQLKRITKRLYKVREEKRQHKYVDCILEDLKVTYLNIMKAYYSKDRTVAFDVEIGGADKIRKCEELLEHLETHRDMEQHEIDNLVILAEKFKDMSTSIKNIARVIIMNAPFDASTANNNVKKKTLNTSSPYINTS